MLNHSNLPSHIAIVMDGNGRWAKKRNMPRIAGHQTGVKVAEKIIEFCGKNKIQVLTLFAFSSENWGRPKEEVDFLMGLFLRTLQRKVKKLHENNIQLRFIGDVKKFSPNLQEYILKSEEKTAKNTGLKLNIAANYSGRWDIFEATKQIAEKIQRGELEANHVTMDTFESHLSLAGLPDPDLLIRTSGEMRISNFMLWQFAYTEFFFTEILWPDFNEEILMDALQSYANRQRRFGLVDVTEAKA